MSCLKMLLSDLVTWISDWSESTTTLLDELSGASFFPPAAAFPLPASLPDVDDDDDCTDEFRFRTPFLVVVVVVVGEMRDRLNRGCCCCCSASSESLAWDQYYTTFSPVKNDHLEPTWE